MQRDDELGLVSKHFGIMVEKLQDRVFICETLGRYLSSQTATKILSLRGGMSLDGEERVANVLFSDLCGYSSISEQMSPAQVVGILNQHLGAMNEIIDEHECSC